MQALAAKIPEMAGGSADLNPSTFTWLKGCGDFQSPATSSQGLHGMVGGDWSYLGRNIHFGVREHAMGSIAVGMALHGGFIPYTATFLTFADYMRPPMRLAALMGLRVIFIFTHDSIGVGEDGPTHQPIEQIMNMRQVPNLTVIRPADANETVEAWRMALVKNHRADGARLQPAEFTGTGPYYMRPGNKYSAGRLHFMGIGTGPEHNTDCHRFGSTHYAGCSATTFRGRCKSPGCLHALLGYF